MTKVLVSDPIDQVGIDILSQVAQVDVRTGLPPAELKQIIGDYDALMIRSGTQVTAEIIEAAPRLKIIGRAGVGVDNVDVPTATKHGVLIMAEWMRDELAAKPIDMHILLPGAVYTGLTSAAIPDPARAPPELGLLMPERCAEIALDGMDKGLFYIPTHAHLIEDMQARHDAMRDATRALGLNG
jgi:NAD(P)-dependent dehydrogenase (short-subunit alcohol dehydrogenase family)